MSDMAMSDKTSRLRFLLGFYSSELSSCKFPVEVRRKDLSLVERVPSSREVELQPGAYYVTVKLPRGQELTRSVLVADPTASPPTGWEDPEVFRLDVGQAKTLDLVPAPGEESPQESLEPSVFLGTWSNMLAADLDRRSADAGDALETLGAGAGDKESLDSGAASPVVPVPVLDSVENQVRWLRGNLLGAEGQPLVVRDDLPGRLEPGQNYSIGSGPRGPNEPQLMQLIRARQLTINVILPAWSPSTCLVRLERLPDGRATLDIRLGNPTADLFLRYIQGAHLVQAQVTSEALVAEDLLADKQEDPIGAAVGAYALLRFRKEDRLHDWTENLMNRFPGLPDGLAIRGEHLARTGDHKGALALFNQIPARGLPIFAVGLSYVTDRLGQYLANKSFTAPYPFDSSALEEGAKVLERLLRFSSRAFFRSSLLTYTGQDPRKPDAGTEGDE